MNYQLQKQALAARDAHLALLDLKHIVDEAARKAHEAELEAVALAIHSERGGDVRPTLRSAVDRLRSAHFETKLSEARKKLDLAIAS
jgi:hypothetical protein